MSKHSYAKRISDHLLLHHGVEPTTVDMIEQEGGYGALYIAHINDHEVFGNRLPHTTLIPFRTNDEDV